MLEKEVTQGMRMHVKSGGGYFDLTHFAENIRAARKGRGMSQKSVAKAMGKSIALVSRWETGASIPSIWNFLYLCWLFDFDPYSFLMVFSEGQKTHMMFDEFAAASTKPLAATAEAMGERDE